MKTVDSLPGFSNMVDDDYEEFEVVGDVAQKVVRILKFSKVTGKVAIPLAVVALFFAPILSVGAVGLKIFWHKLEKYDYCIYEAQRVRFTMRPEEVEKLHKQQEKKIAKKK